MSNSAQGTVLAGAPVAVTAGSGITIDPSTGVISVNAATVSGLVRLNSSSAYNAYVWPTAKGTADQFLQTDASGNLTWADAAGFAVVTVSNFQPAPPQEGELWFDCTTGTLKIYQTCVAPGGWTATDQSGLPALPGNVTATPPFTGGSGTLASPFDCTVTTTGAGTTTYVINSVKIVGFVPFQYVPIVDLDAFANGGRFSFSNYYADAAGELFFQTIFTDAPASPSGTSYTAAIKVGYGTVYIDAVVNVVAALVVTGGTITGPAYVGQQLTYTPGVPSGGQTPYGSPTIKWFANGVQIGGAAATTFTLTGAQLGANITASTTYTDAASQISSGTSNSLGPVLAAPAALSVLPGSLSPTTAVVGNTLTYSGGSFSGGVPAVTATWVWQRNGVDISGTAGTTSYQLVTADAGKAITVRYSATDSSTPSAVTAFASTAAVTPTEPFNSTVWSGQTGSMTTIPGGITGTYNGTSTSITTTGCIEASVNGQPYASGTQTIAASQTLAIRWSTSGTCGGAASGTSITGTLSDGTYQNSYTATVNRVPSPAISITPSTLVPLGGTIASTSTATVLGLTTAAYVTLGTGSTGSNIRVSTDGSTWTTLSGAPGAFLLINNGQTLHVEQTVGTSTSIGYTAVLAIGDSTGVGGAASTYQTVTYTATTVSSAAFPNSPFTPVGGPNASPANTLVGSLDGEATTTWADGTTNLTATGSLQFKVGAGSYTQTSTLVNNSDVVTLAWDPTAATSAADNGSLTGTLTNGTYTNSYTLTVDKQPAAYTWTDLTNQSASTAISSNIITITSINCPAELTITNSGTNDLTSVQASINGGVFTAVPTSSPGLVVNPADLAGTTATTIQLKGTTGSTAGGTYTITTNIGKGAAVVSDTWSVGVSAAVPSIATPSITSPVSPNNTNLNPNSYTPTGIPISGSTYSNLNGAGAQTSSTWEVYKWVGGGAATPPTTDPPGANYTAITGSPFTVSASPFTSLNIPLSSLAVSSTYYVRTKYSTTSPSAIDSSYSAWSSFTTASQFVPVTVPGNLYFLSSTGTLTAYTGSTIKNPFAYYQKPSTAFASQPGVGGINSSNAILEAAGRAGGSALSPLAAPSPALSNVESFIPFYGANGGAGISVKTDGSVDGLKTDGSASPLSIPLGVGVKAVSGCGGVTDLGYALLTDGSLFCFAGNPSGVNFGGTTITTNSWTAISYTLPAGETLEQICAFGGGNYDANMFILRTASGKLYAVGTTGTGLGIPTTGTWSSPAYIAGTADFIAIATCGTNFIAGGNLNYGFSGVKSNGDLWAAMANGLNYGTNLSWVGVGVGWLTPLWSGSCSASNGSPGNVYTGLKTDGKFYYRAAQLSAGASFSQINYGAVTANPVYSVGPLPYSLQAYFGSDTVPTQGSYVFIP
jgi:hypothetical protein